MDKAVFSASNIRSAVLDFKSGDENKKLCFEGDESKVLFEKKGSIIRRVEGDLYGDALEVFKKIREYNKIKLLKT